MQVYPDLSVVSERPCLKVCIRVQADDTGAGCPGGVGSFQHKRTRACWHPGLVLDPTQPPQGSCGPMPGLRTLPMERNPLGSWTSGGSKGSLLR